VPAPGPRAECHPETDISIPATETLAARATHAIEVKRSRFVAYADHVDTPDEALAFVDGIHDRSAHHHCWAWRIGEEYRSSDDGEPAGSAGRPILAAIDGQELDRVMVVVARWFGGTRLGVGGLVRAYGGTAAECLRAASRRALVQHAQMQVACDFADTGEAHAALLAHHADKLEERFDAKGVTLRIRVPEGQVEGLARRLRDATRDRARITRTDGGRDTD
jgi:uncharacterized YigZ family protein